MHILVIEDDSSLRDLYQQFLTRAGHTIVLSADGWEGFKEGGTGTFDLIIADLNMPNWDGITSIKGILELNPSMSFIVVTGFPQSEIAEEAQGIEQVKHLLAKPIDFHDLLDLIDEQ